MAGLPQRVSSRDVVVPAMPRVPCESDYAAYFAEESVKESESYFPSCNTEHYDVNDDMFFLPDDDDEIDRARVRAALSSINLCALRAHQ